MGGAVVLQDGTKIKADVIVVGAGVVPSTVSLIFFKKKNIYI